MTTSNVYGWVKLFLHDGADQEESVWAETAGERAGRPVFRLKNIPFLRLSPTWGDIVFASPSAKKNNDLVVDGVAEKGGRWVAVYNYFPDNGATAADVVTRLSDAGKKNDLVVEPCLEPREGIAGCVYIAAPQSTKPKDVDAIVYESGAPADLERVIPLEIRGVRAQAPTKTKATKATKATTTTSSTSAKAKPAVTAKTKAKPTAKAKAKSNAKPAAKVKAKAKPKAKAKAKAKPKANAKPKAKANAKPRAKAKTKPKARAKAKKK